jgi:uncharacterized protein YjiS (DUF1127 family)
MATNIHNQSSLGKFSELLFVRQTPYEAAEKHKSLLDGFKAWRQRRAAEAELASLSDRDLSDIGLTRQGIPAAVRVHRPIR